MSVTHFDSYLTVSLTPSCTPLHCDTKLTCPNVSNCHFHQKKAKQAGNIPTEFIGMQKTAKWVLKKSIGTLWCCVFNSSPQCLLSVWFSCRIACFVLLSVWQAVWKILQSSETWYWYADLDSFQFQDCATVKMQSLYKGYQIRKEGKMKNDLKLQGRVNNLKVKVPFLQHACVSSVKLGCLRVLRDICTDWPISKKVRVPNGSVKHSYILDAWTAGALKFSLLFFSL